MRAMPSPTDSTVPTSETSASASKFAIWSRMTREISAARMSIVYLAFHRGSEPVEFGADRGVDALAAQLDDDPAEDAGVHRRLEDDVAAGAGAQLRLQRRDLVVAQRAGGEDLGDGLAAVLCCDPLERPDDRAQRALAAVPCEHADELGGDRVEAGVGGERGQRLCGLVAADQRAVDELGEFARIEQRLVERVEPAGDGIDLSFIAGKVEQSRGVAPC